MNEIKTTLYSEKGTFKDDKGNEVSYTSYYVDVMGLRVKVKPCDNTAKQLLTIAFSGDVK